MYGDIETALKLGFFIFAITVPLAIWKMIDISIWFFKHVSWS